MPDHALAIARALKPLEHPSSPPRMQPQDVVWRHNKGLIDCIFMYLIVVQKGVNALEALGPEAFGEIKAQAP